MSKTGELVYKDADSGELRCWVAEKGDTLTCINGNIALNPEDARDLATKILSALDRHNECKLSME